MPQWAVLLKAALLMGISMLDVYQIYAQTKQPSIMQDVMLGFLVV